jgi:hypothetical protein
MSAATVPGDQENVDKAASAPPGPNGEVVHIDFRDARLQSILEARRANTQLVVDRKELFPDLDSKLAYIESELRPLGKNADNEDDGWKYTSIDVIVETIKELTRSLGVSVSFKAQPDKTTREWVKLSGNTPGLYVYVWVTMLLKDLDSGENQEWPCEGEAWDTKGKALGQAITFARRNGLLTRFNIVTRDEVANEGDRKSVKLVAAPPQSGTGISTPPDPTAPADVETPPKPARGKSDPPAIRQLLPGSDATNGHVSAAALEAELFGDDAADNAVQGATATDAADPDKARRDELIKVAESLYERKGKTPADASQFLRALTKVPTACVFDVPIGALEQLVRRLENMPDYMIPFTTAS